MKSEEIKQLFIRFESAASEIEGVECWSAREMQLRQPRCAGGDHLGSWQHRNRCRGNQAGRV